ncbi:MAG: helix-turn-helix transcriptional regulator [Clostridiales bacterium]|nr:helix-turn-helix transcriptional regulator [Clostridiales bacterium]
MAENALKQEKHILSGRSESRYNRMSDSYDEELIERFIHGILQNIKTETLRQNISYYDLASRSDLSYVHITKLFSGRTEIGLTGLVKLSIGLGKNPAEFMPLDINHRKTNGERFDELTKELDLDSCNFLLQMVAEYAKQFRKMKC